jgi:hypothetical protein
MKRFVLLVIMTICALSFIKSQEIFDKGEIITKNNDTLHVFVRLATTYYDEVPYKLDKSSNVLYKKINEIRTLVTPYNIFENVLVKKTEELFRLVVKGKISLLEYVEINQGPSASAYGGNMTMYNEPTIVYALKTAANTDYILKKKKEKIQIIQLFVDCPDLKLKIEDKSFKLEDLEDIVTKFNICK